MQQETEFEPEDVDMPEEFIPVVVKVRTAQETQSMEGPSVPAFWLDNLAFSGSGFAVTVNIPAGMTLPAGSTIRVELGRYVDRDGEPPFDPPYASNAKRSE